NDGGSFTSVGFNLASDAAGGDDTTGPGGLLDVASDRRNTDPLLGPLQRNGGPTDTHALLPGSPAVDQGKRDTIATLGDTTDQRGFSRSIDDATIADAADGDGSDVGALEAQPARDFAVTALKVPAQVGLKGSAPSVTKKLKVQVQNRSAAAQVVPDLATL